MVVAQQLPPHREGEFVTSLSFFVVAGQIAEVSQVVEGLGGVGMLFTQGCLKYLVTLPGQCEALAKPAFFVKPVYPFIEPSGLGQGPLLRGTRAAFRPRADEFQRSY